MRKYFVLDFWMAIGLALMLFGLGDGEQGKLPEELVIPDHPHPEPWTDILAAVAAVVSACAAVAGVIWAKRHRARMAEQSFGRVGKPRKK